MVAALTNVGAGITVDIVLLALVLGNALAGWRTGLLRRVVAGLGVYGGVLAAVQVANGIASYLHHGDIFANAWSFIAVFGLVVVLFEVLGHLLDDRLQRIAVVVFDRATGAVLGAIVGFLEVSVLFMVALAVGAAPSLPTNTVPAQRDAAAQAVRASTLGSQAVRAQPIVRGLFAAVLPRDLTRHLLEGTAVTPPS